MTAATVLLISLVVAASTAVLDNRIAMPDSFQNRHDGFGVPTEGSTIVLLIKGVMFYVKLV